MTSILSIYDIINTAFMTSDLLYMTSHPLFKKSHHFIYDIMSTVSDLTSTVSFSSHPPIDDIPATILMVSQPVYM